MTESDLIRKIDNACEDIDYYLLKFDKLTEEGKLTMKNRLKELQSEILFKKTDWGN